MFFGWMVYLNVFGYGDKANIARWVGVKGKGDGRGGGGKW